MNMLRNVMSWISLYLVGTGIFLTANVFVLFHVVSASNIKQTVKEEGTYSKVVPAILSTASYGDATPAEGQLPLREPWVTAAAEKAFPPEDLEQKSRALIDGVFNWLTGDTTKPEFRLDFTDNKQRLGDEIGKSTEERLKSLPRCDLNNIPSSVDAFKATCLPYGVSPATIANSVAGDITNDQGFLKDPIITSDSLFSQASELGVEKEEANPFDRLQGLQSFYEHKSLLLWGLPLATVVLAVLGFALANDRTKAVRRLSRSFLSAGVGLMVLGLLLGFGLRQAINATARDAVSRDLAAPVMLNLVSQAQIIYLSFAGVALLLAAALFFTRKRLTPSRR